MAAMASKSRPPPPPLAQGLDSPLISQAWINTSFHRFTEIGKIFQNYSETPERGLKRNKKSITFRKGTQPWISLEGARCFGNQSPLILDPRLYPDVAQALFHP